jgi:hypothetical protein
MLADYFNVMMSTKNLPYAVDSQHRADVRLDVSGARNWSWKKTGLDDGAIHQIKYVPRRQKRHTFSSKAEFEPKQKEFAELIKHRCDNERNQKHR